ncbi:LLM class flavin-dependent oxidoreductase [Salisediminibacterium selenitireducens]|uniref:Luciferase family oxidoreductase, group 1 n=1 Tax=Bacillus selenitireducens (strain ATCC 700615 / DSM 15326 / MLS10) TaxID=439292 RepID=D6XZ79_BACIE|nr:LLM class flavin-dependent oxidoreductase [Salisediminibacterium selenitireducens]ADI00364.1 luciferase family oxidoreductase, group 1 [[Bacillus] selenitireducens MLS10]
MKLSILDQAPVTSGHSPEEALRFAVELAKIGDELGYHRFWMAEHHATDAFASSAPEITISHIAAVTDRIRLGTGGVMMMHYSPLKLAETFKTLAALAPGRIDFGAGRAPGGDSSSIYALSSGREPMIHNLYEKFAVTMQYLADQTPDDPLYRKATASPNQIHPPEAWLLGSSGNSAKQAGRMGVGYSFAQFFNGELSKEILDTYRSHFEPSSLMDAPEVNVSYMATVADSEEEARFHALPQDLARLMLMQGKIVKTMSPEEAAEYPLTELDRMRIEDMRRLHLVGTPAQVGRALAHDQERFGFDETMIVCNAHSYKVRQTVYEKLASEIL